MSLLMKMLKPAVENANSPETSKSVKALDATFAPIHDATLPDSRLRLGALIAKVVNGKTVNLGAKLYHLQQIISQFGINFKFENDMTCSPGTYSIQLYQHGNPEFRGQNGPINMWIIATVVQADQSGMLYVTAELKTSVDAGWIPQVSNNTLS